VTGYSLPELLVITVVIGRTTTVQGFDITMKKQFAKLPHFYSNPVLSGLWIRIDFNPDSDTDPAF
jgi:hypothetical protein